MKQPKNKCPNTTQMSPNGTPVGSGQMSANGMPVNSVAMAPSMVPCSGDL